MGATEALSCLEILARERLGLQFSKNVGFPQGLVTWKGGLAFEGFVACLEGQFGCVQSVLLP